MELILALLMNNLAVNSVPAAKLAPAILQVANKYNVDPILIAKIIVVESRGREKAINKQSSDYGLMQINVNTAKSMGISDRCLMNWRCNLDAGAKILSRFNRPCRYNVGTTKVLAGKRLQNCIRYERKLASVN